MNWHAFTGRLATRLQRHLQTLFVGITHVTVHMATRRDALTALRLLIDVYYSISGRTLP